jgi:ubiquinone biosynthesis protein
MTSLSKALLTLDGTLRVIDPGFDLAREATAAAESMSTSDPEVLGELLQEEFRRSLPLLRVLPEHLDELATQLRTGRMRVRVDRFGGGGDGPAVSAWIDRVLVAVFGCVGLLSSAVLLVAAELATTKDIRLALQAVGFIGVVLSSVLFMRAVAGVLRRERTTPTAPRGPV